MAGWDPLSQLLRMELVQRREEGCDVTGFEVRVETAVQAGDEAQMERVYDELAALPVRKDFPFEEPSDLEGIRSRRIAGPRHLPGETTGKEFKAGTYHFSVPITLGEGSSGYQVHPLTDTF
jgi:hypothetical protein